MPESICYLLGGELVNREKFSHKVCVYAIFSLTL